MLNTVLFNQFYSYHRSGLDLMHDDNEKGRGFVTESIENMRKVKQLNPTAFILQLFFNAKADEIASIYSNAFQEKEVYKLLTQIDPANINKYNKIKEQSSNNAPIMVCLILINNAKSFIH